MKLENYTLFKSFVRYSLLLAALAYVNNSAAQASYGFAWANEATKSAYTPSSNYSFNSTGGPIVVQRSGVGQYQVTFKKLGGHGKDSGHVQVTAYGAGSEYCKVRNWNTKNKHLRVSVNCFGKGSNPIDTQFTIYTLRPNTTTAPVSEAPAVKKKLLPDGRLQMTYPDGSKKTMNDCGYDLERPNLPSTSVSCYIQVVALTVPSPPPDQSDEQKWLSRVSEQMLSSLSALVGNDEESMENYIDSEGELSIYEQLNTRSKILAVVAGAK